MRRDVWRVGVLTHFPSPLSKRPPSRLPPTRYGVDLDAKLAQRAVGAEVEVPEAVQRLQLHLYARITDRVEHAMEELEGKARLLRASA